MLTLQDDQRVKWFYSQGRISFEELLSVLNGNVMLEALEAERMAL